MTERQPCGRCGAMVLPETLIMTGGQCMPCKKGLRQMWEHHESMRRQEQLRRRAFRWDNTANDLCLVSRDIEIAFDKRVIPRSVFAWVLDMFVPETRVIAWIAARKATSFSLDQLETAAEPSSMTLDWRASPEDCDRELKRSFTTHRVGLATTEIPVAEDAREDERFEKWILALNAALPEHEFRAWRQSLGSDTLSFALAARHRWRELSDRYPQLATAAFVELH